MRKLISTTIILLLCAILSASSLSTAGIALGGTMKDNAFTLGLSASTVQVSDLGRHLGTGVGAGMDISIMLTNDDWDGLFACYIGPGFYIRPFENFAISTAVGPCIVTENGSFGVGFAVNASVIYFLNDSFGISAGTTAYSQLFVHDEARNVNASFAGSAYLGISWRRKEYDWATNTIYDPRRP